MFDTMCRPMSLEEQLEYAEFNLLCAKDDVKELKMKIRERDGYKNNGLYYVKEGCE